jgi:putative nucleotidyltransferase with HDIG domain
MSALANPPVNRREQFAAAIEQMNSMPGVQAILQPLLSYLQQPFESQDMQRIVDLISHDNSLAAQCLHMANSPLFGRWQSITSVRAAVVALGLQRMREVAVSCCMLKLVPAEQGNSPVVLWEHSLGCALLARKLAKRIGVRDPEQMYLAGLLHDLGLMVNLQIAGDEFMTLLQHAEREQRPLHDLEEELWGCSHCDTGAMLARNWDLAPLISDVIKQHHRVSQLSNYRSSVALVALCDVLCRTNGLGYGYAENISVDANTDLISAIADEWPMARNVNWRQVGTELVSYLADVRKLVSVLFRMPA